MFERAVYETRRSKLAARLRERGAAGFVLLAAHPESPVNYQGNCYPFRQDSNWLYFIGLTEPDMLALIDVADGSAVLFGDTITMDDMVWTGPKPGPKELAALSGIDSVQPLSRAGDALAGVARGDVHYPPFAREETRRKVARLLGLSAEELEKGASRVLIAAIVALREIKEDREIAEMEKASAVSAEMHSTVLREFKPGWTEGDAAALAQYVAMKRGCSLSFATIATVRGEVLHNHGNGALCREGDLFLMDAGAEMPSGYAGDLTTTFPVGGAFPSKNAELYRVLLDMFASATASLKPGLRFVEAHLRASLALARGLKNLGIMRGDPEEAVRAGAHALFFPHGLGHMIGLDVHDMEGLGEDNVGYSDTARSPQFGLSALRLAKPLLPGMVHSVEPGIYFIPGLIDAWRAQGLAREFINYGELDAWRGCGGMRIEEDWLVGETACRRLGPAIDKSVEAIERARMGK